MKHTESPWLIDTESTTDYEIFSDGEDYGGGVIATVYSGSNIIDTNSVAFANAKLVAAAPDMANELKESANWLMHLSNAVLVDGIDLNQLSKSLKIQADAMLKAYHKATS